MSDAERQHYLRILHRLQELAWKYGPPLEPPAEEVACVPTWGPVGVLAARSGASHGQLHAQLRRAVPGPASAAADADVLERRRDHLMALLGGAG